MALDMLILNWWNRKNHRGTEKNRLITTPAYAGAKDWHKVS